MKRPSDGIQSQVQPAKKQRIGDQSQNKLNPNSRSNNRRKQSMLVSLPPALRQYELVWAKVKGYSLWPGIIEAETPKGRYRIHFFGDYSSCDVSKNKIVHMMEGFNTFLTVDIHNPKLNKAINEAKFFVFNEKWTSCPICDMLLQKMGQNASDENK